MKSTATDQVPAKPPRGAQIVARLRGSAKPAMSTDDIKKLMRG